MTAEALDSPFDQQVITEVHLQAAPLALVLAQVRHPALVVLSGSKAEETVGKLAQDLANDYPIMDQVREKEILITTDGVSEGQGSSTIWRLRSADERWRVSVSQQFLALDTSKYVSRNDFCARFDRLVSAYAKLVKPPYLERSGMRYVNRIDSEQDLSSLVDLVRPEVLGPSAIKCPPGTKLVHALTQMMAQSDGFGLKAQWGNLPPGAMLDPTLEATDQPSWILDIDSFSPQKSSFDELIVGAQIRELAERAYRFFRWAVTDQYLNRFAE